MTIAVYNFSLLVGLLLVSLGIGLWNVPAGIATAGALLIVLTILNALVIGPRMGKR